MIAENGMSTITVKKEALLKTLQENRAKHEAEFKAADADYRKAMVDVLRTAAKEAAKRVTEGERFTSSDIEFPQAVSNHLKEYDRVIQMLSWSISDEVVVTESEFRRFVLDEWHWKEIFSSTMSYNSQLVNKGHR